MKDNQLLEPEIGMVYPGEDCDVMYLGNKQTDKSLEKIGWGEDCPHVVLIRDRGNQAVSIRCLENLPVINERTIAPPKGKFTQSDYWFETTIESERLKLRELMKIWKGYEDKLKEEIIK